MQCILQFDEIFYHEIQIHMLFHILIFISVIFLMWFLRNFRLNIISVFDVTILLTVPIVNYDVKNSSSCLIQNFFKTISQQVYENKNIKLCT